MGMINGTVSELVADWIVVLKKNLKWLVCNFLLKYCFVSVVLVFKCF